MLLTSTIPFKSSIQTPRLCRSNALEVFLISTRRTESVSIVVVVVAYLKVLLLCCAAPKEAEEPSGAKCQENEARGNLNALAEAPVKESMVKGFNCKPYWLPNSHRLFHQLQSANLQPAAFRRPAKSGTS